MKSRAQSRTFPPRWFDLDKYDGVDDFGAYQWFHHLLVRSLFAMKLAGELSGENEKTWLVAIDKLRQKPLLLSDEMQSICGGTQPDHDDRQAFAGVRSMTWKDLYDDGDGVIVPNIDRLRELRNFHDQCKAAGLVFVDLMLPDRVLERQFRGWLTDIRASLAAAAKHHKYYGPDFKKWRDVKLLPCMDLLLWGMQQHLRIPPRELSNALFPLQPSKADVVRRTTRPRAMQFLEPLRHPRGWNLLLRLKVEVVHEASEMDRAGAKMAKRTAKKVV